MGLTCCKQVLASQFPWLSQRCVYCLCKIFLWHKSDEKGVVKRLILGIEHGESFVQECAREDHLLDSPPIISSHCCFSAPDCFDLLCFFVSLPFVCVYFLLLYLLACRRMYGHMEKQRWEESEKRK